MLPPMADPDNDTTSALLKDLVAAVETALVGKRDVVNLATVALLAGGHVLIEDVPGVGKTTLARALAAAVDGVLHRVQFTSDLLPSDLIGVLVFNQQQAEFSFRKGPLFCNILLADEINRASPRTQSALMEAMSERQISVDGTTLALPQPFFVLATQNPDDHAGTFPLPESQLDRFMLRIRIGYPPSNVETRLLLQGDMARETRVPKVLHLDTLLKLQAKVSEVRFDDSLAAYLQAILQATRSHPVLSMGASTRAGLNLARAARARAILNGRTYCLVDDIYELIVPVLAHRIRLAVQSEGYAPSTAETHAVLYDIASRVPVPL